MARSFAGSERVYYGVAPSNTWAIGTCAFRFKHTSTANMIPHSICTTSMREGYHIITNLFGAGKMGLEAYKNTSPSSVTLATVGTGYADGNWHHFAFNFNVANGSANTIYGDGVQEATQNAVSTWSIDGSLGGANAINLGDDPGAFFTDYVGELAEFGLWIGGQLTVDEIASLAKGAPPSAIRPGLLEVYAPLVRDTHDQMGRAVSSQIGGAVTPHPRMMGGTI